MQAAQIVHAAGESSPGNLPEGTNAVVLTVNNEAVLARLADAMTGAGVKLVRVREPDRNNELMAIGLLPVTDRREVRRHTSMLPLLR